MVADQPEIRRRTPRSALAVVPSLATALATAAVLRTSVLNLVPDDAGVIAQAMSLSTLLCVGDAALALGCARAAARAAVNTPAMTEAQANVVACARVTRLLSLALLCAAVPLALLVVPPGGRTGAATTAGCGAVLAGAAVQLWCSAPAAALAGRARYGLLATASTASCCAVVGLCAVPSQLPRVLEVGVALAAGQLVRGVVILAAARRQLPWLPASLPRRQDTNTRGLLAGQVPLAVMTTSAVVVVSSDVLLVGAFASPSAAVAYQAGLLVPQFASSLLFRAYDAILPSLVAAERRVQILITAARSRVLCAASGLLLGVLGLRAADVLRLVQGTPTPLAVQVSRVIVLVCLLAVTTHGAALLLVAQGRERVLAVLAVAEVVVNLGVSLALLSTVGPIGGALGTLVTMALANLLVLPRLPATRDLASLLLVGAGRTATGAAVAAASGVAAANFPDPVSRCVVHFGLAGSAAGVLVLAVRVLRQVVPGRPDVVTS